MNNTFKFSLFFVLVVLCEFGDSTSIFDSNDAIRIPSSIHPRTSTSRSESEEIAWRHRHHMHSVERETRKHFDVDEPDEGLQKRIDREMRKMNERFRRLLANLEENFNEKLKELEEKVENKIDAQTLLDQLDSIKSGLEEVSNKADSCSELYLNETEKNRVDIEKLTQKFNYLNETTTTSAHYKIPSEMLISTRQILNGSISNLKQELESTWSALFSAFLSKTKEVNGTTPSTNTTEINRRVWKSEMTGKSCKELKMKYNLNKNDIYFIQPNFNGRKVEIYCDMEGGGWSVIQRRGVRDIPKAQRESFNRSWIEYEEGFGSVRDDHWIGLKNIHYLTNQDKCGTELMINVTEWDGTEKYASHENFSVSGSVDDYRLSIEGYLGNVSVINGGGTMLLNNHQKFFTFDRDNRGYECVARNGSAWWYSSRGWGCASIYLNGEYSEDGEMGQRDDGIFWDSNDTGFASNSSYSFKKTQMKIKSKC